MVRILSALSIVLIFMAALVGVFVLKSQISSTKVDVSVAVNALERQRHGNVTASPHDELTTILSVRTTNSSVAKNTHIPTRDVMSGAPFGSGQRTSGIAAHTGTAGLLDESAQPEIAWCVLDANNTYRFQHFAHASQSLFPCWSYFERMRLKNANVSCGFWFQGWTPRKSRYTWQTSLMTAMGCIQTSIPPKFSRQHFYRIELIGGFVTSVNNRTTIPDIRWFDRPSDGWALREIVLKSYNLSISPRSRSTQKKRDQLRIGFVRRIKRKRRVIVNEYEIVAALQQTFPRVLVTNATLEWMNLGEQAQYFASQDVIVAAHGAALTNCAFLQPGSIVVQLYPKHYFPTFFFEPLIRQVKSHPYAWYDGYPDNPLQDHIQNPNTMVNRQVDLNPPMHEILAIIKNATLAIKIWEAEE